MKMSRFGISTLMFIVMGSASAFAADSGVKVGGFVDAQYFWNNSKVATGGNPIQNSEGFVINDGAIYMSHELGSGQVKLDIPFTSRGGGADFAVGRTRAQAYVEQKYDSGVKWRLGQWDTIIGFELNDTVDVAFSRQGVVYNNVMPFVQNGLLVGYELNKTMTVNLFVSNKRENGTLLSTDNPEFGGQFAMATDALRLAVSGIVNKDQASGQMLNLIDVVAGTNLGALALDVELATNVPTPAADRGMAFLVNGIYTVTDTINAGARVEYVNKAYAGLATKSAANHKVFQATVGPQIALTKAFRTKVDYTFNSDTDGAGASAVKNHAVAVAGVYKF